MKCGQLRKRFTVFSIPGGFYYYHNRIFHSGLWVMAGYFSAFYVDWQFGRFNGWVNQVYAYYGIDKAIVQRTPPVNPP